MPVPAPQRRLFLTRERAKDARKRTLGGYAWVGKSVSDMRMAVQEAGSVICTARIHPGWRKPQGHHPL